MAEKKSEQLVPDEMVMSKIYILREQRVMLDKDLAELYGIMPIRLREQVKRNIERFPERFMFQLSENEVDVMVSHFAIPSKQSLGGSLPYVFTEHGVLMLANVLRSKTAIAVSIRIIEIFVKMREMLSTQTEVLLKLELLETQVAGHDEHIQVIFAHLKELLNPPEKPRPRVGFRRSDEQD